MPSNSFASRAKIGLFTQTFTHSPTSESHFALVPAFPQGATSSDSPRSSLPNRPSRAYGPGNESPESSSHQVPGDWSAKIDRLGLLKPSDASKGELMFAVPPAQWFNGSHTPQLKGLWFFPQS